MIVTYDIMMWHMILQGIGVLCNYLLTDSNIIQDMM
jgi:hypothetical protein